MIFLPKKNVLILVFVFLSSVFIVLPAQFVKAEPVAASNVKLKGINNYKIGIGDVLEIITWKEPDFSRNDVLVRLDGKITLPMLDDILAAGKQPTQLKKNIQVLLKHYIEEPNVTVIVRQPVSQKFYILGEVQRIGEYPLVKKLTIVQAFAMAGGFTEWATKKEILLFRKEKNKKTKVIKVDYRKIIRGEGLNQDIVLKADDTIIVP